jgi:hypothetical protein
MIRRARSGRARGTGSRLGGSIKPTLGGLVLEPLDGDLEIAAAGATTDRISPPCVNGMYRGAATIVARVDRFQFYRSHPRPTHKTNAPG